jgi:hypothetical protein
MKTKITALMASALLAIASGSAQERPQRRVEQYIDSLKSTHRIEYLGEGQKPSPVDERALLDIF